VVPASRYGDAIVETNALIEQFQGWSVELAPHAEVLSTMTSEQEHIVERLEAERANLEALKEAADTYNTYLLCTQEFFEKTTTLEELAGWMLGQSATFEAEECVLCGACCSVGLHPFSRCRHSWHVCHSYGSDLASTNNLISLHNETFKVALPAKKQVRSSVLARGCGCGCVCSCGCACGCALCGRGTHQDSLPSRHVVCRVSDVGRNGDVPRGAPGRD